MRITERGQLTLPKRLRAKYGITPSTELDVLETEDGLLIVKKLGTSPFQKFVGRANATGLLRSTDKFLRLIRDGE